MLIENKFRIRVEISKYNIISDALPYSFPFPVLGASEKRKLVT